MDMKKNLVTLALAAAVSSNAFAVDFGQKVEQLAKAQSLSLFGTLSTLGASSTGDLTATQINANPAALLTVAPGLSVSVVSADVNLAPNIDQMVFWPNDTNPTHIIACNEQGSAQVAVQRISLSTGVPENIISSGMTSCDPVRRTPWGTIIAAEENGTSGRVFEILDPLTTTGVTVSGSGAATTTSDTAHVAFRPALGMMSFEGFALYPNGVMYMTDENRPTNGAPGGAIFKFIPSSPWVSGNPSITNLASSPFTAGSIYGLRVGKRSGNTDYGQGNEFGQGTWVPVTGTAPIDLRTAASTLKLTSYYRPEDAELDPKATAAGNVRFCGTNTGDDTPAGDNHWGEVYCVTDGSIAGAANTSTLSTPEYQVLAMGQFDFGMPDNIAYQTSKGAWLINEDGEGPVDLPARNNDIWSCLDDGADADHFADACVKLMSLNDLTAESTGGFFDPTGKHYYVSIQHNKSNHGVILKVDGWN
jgi:hypothetical protein